MSRAAGSSAIACNNAAWVETSSREELVTDEVPRADDHREPGRHAGAGLRRPRREALEQVAREPDSPRDGCEVLEREAAGPQGLEDRIADPQPRVNRLARRLKDELHEAADRSGRGHPRRRRGGRRSSPRRRQAVCSLHAGRHDTVVDPECPVLDEELDLRAARSAGFEPTRSVPVFDDLGTVAQTRSPPSGSQTPRAVFEVALKAELVGERDGSRDAPAMPPTTGTRRAVVIAGPSGGAWWCSCGRGHRAPPSGLVAATLRQRLLAVTGQPSRCARPPNAWS